MVEIRPFKAIRYTEKAGEPEKLITQPYDKITPEMQEEYYEKSEYNYCRLILPIEENRYEMAKKRVDRWISDGILKKDEERALYIYFQDFEVLGRRYTRKGFISAVKLHPFEEKIVLPHEKTHKGPKIDRLNMLRATKKNLEAGFMLYPDVEKKTIGILEKLSKERPIIDAVDGYGGRNRIWALSDPEDIKVIQEVIGPEQVVIADGHHRYETALTFRDELRARGPWDESGAFNFRMTLMVPIQDKGLVVLPTHRLLLKHELKDGHMKELEKYFGIQELERNDIEEFLEKNRERKAFVVYDGKRYLGLVLKDFDAVQKFFKPEYSEEYRNLDVVILRDIIFEGIMGARDLKIDESIAYERWIDDAVKKVDAGDAGVAFLMNPTGAHQVLNVAKNGERMPEKSTDFYPKMVSGTTMMDLKDKL